MRMVRCALCVEPLYELRIANFSKNQRCGWAGVGFFLRRSAKPLGEAGLNLTQPVLCQASLSGGKGQSSFVDSRLDLLVSAKTCAPCLGNCVRALPCRGQCMSLVCLTLLCVLLLAAMVILQQALA